MQTPNSEIISRALQEMENAERALRLSANTMAQAIDGRLRHVSRGVLRRLKRQLADFDAVKMEWKAGRDT